MGAPLPFATEGGWQVALGYFNTQPEGADTVAWIESHQTLGQHPKTKRLARYLGISLPTAVGHLHYLWWWAMDYAQDGHLGRYEPADIAAAAMWEGDPHQFVDAMLKAGFLDQNENGLAIHDWDDYAGRIIEARLAERERSRRRRLALKSLNDPRTTGGRPPDDQNPTTGQPSDDHRPTVGTIPNLTVPNLTGPNQENRSIDRGFDRRDNKTPPGKKFKGYDEETKRLIRSLYVT